MHAFKNLNYLIFVVSTGKRMISNMEQDLELFQEQAVAK